MGFEDVVIFGGSSSNHFASRGSSPTRIVPASTSTQPTRNSRYHLAEGSGADEDESTEDTINQIMTNHTELFKQFSDNPAFKRWLGDAIFSATYQERAG